MGNNEKFVNLFVVILLITLIALYVIKNYGNIMEAYTSYCETQDEGSNFIDCYYKRLRHGSYKNNFDAGNYRSEVYLIREPTDYNDKNMGHRVGVVLFYLKYRKQFPKIGCGTGWENRIDENANDVISDWAYYIHRTLMDNNTKTTVSTGNDNNKNYTMGNLKYYHEPHSRVLKDTLVPSDRTAESYLAIKNKYANKLDKNIFHVLMITFLAHYLHNDTRTDYNAFYRWGVPVFKSTRINRGVVERIPISSTTQSFNYYYNIKFNDKYLAYDTASKNFKINTVTDTTQLSDPNLLFRIIYKSDCGDYMKIKSEGSGGYLKADDYANDAARNTHISSSISEEDGTSFFLDYKHINNDLSVDINKILIPSSVGQTDNIDARTGDYVTILAKTNRSKAFMSYLTEGTNGLAKIHRILNPTSSQIDQMTNNGITISGIDCSGHNKFRFVRQRLFNPAKYVYKERLLNDTSTDAPAGSKIDVGGIYEFIYDTDRGGRLGSDEITNMRNVTTNQKVFPVYNDSDDAKDCVYTGTQETTRAIQNVCGLESGCYGEFKSPNDNYERIYVGPGCNLPIKKVKKTGDTIDKKERKGAILCNNATDNENTILTKRIEDTSARANICYLPRHSDNVQPSTSLIHPRSADHPECRENRDYGMLDSPTLEMYVANNDCRADYKYFNDPLKSVGGERVCKPGELCEFSNSISPGEGNYTFLNENDFTVIKNQNIALRNELGQLEKKLSTFKQDISNKDKHNEVGEEHLLNELNESIFDKLNTNLMKLNQVAFDELNKK